MKERIMLFLKGVVIGMAMIIPGVSGGTLAISLGIYERIIKTISHPFKDFKENVKFVLTLGLGVVASLAICSIVLDYTFENYPIPTILFFIGLILGSVPMLFDKVNVKKSVNPVNVILLIVGAAVLFGISFLKGDNQDIIFGGFTFIQSFKLAIVGFVAAATLVIPGISGSFMLMTLGYYEPILGVISSLVKLNNIGDNLLILVPFGLGVVLGVFVIAKIIEYFINKHETGTYYVIIGFLLASILDIFLRLFNYSTNLLQIVIGIVLFGAGCLLSFKVFKD